MIGLSVNVGQGGSGGKEIFIAGLGRPADEIVAMTSDGDLLGESIGTVEHAVASSKEVNLKRVASVRQNFPKESGGGNCSPREAANSLLLPKDLYDEIKSLDHTGAKKLSYKDMLTGEIGHVIDGDLNKELPHENKGVEPSARSKMLMKYYKSSDGPIELIPDENIMDSMNNCVVGYFIGRKLGFRNVEAELKRLWPCLVKVIRNEKGFFFLHFSNKEDMENFLENGYCHVFGRLMVIKKWHCMLKLNKEAMELIPIWVRFYDVPLEFWSCDNLSKLASRLGRPLYLDQATEKMQRVTYARVCVEIDSSKQMPSILQIKNGEDVVDIEVRYQWVPIKCDLCKMFGHKEGSCPKTKGAKEEKVSHRPGLVIQNKISRNGSGKDVTLDKLPENQWSYGRKRTADRRGNGATIGEINKKYVRVDKDKGKEVVKVNNSFDVIADFITKQELLGEGDTKVPIPYESSKEPTVGECDVPKTIEEQIIDGSQTGLVNVLGKEVGGGVTSEMPKTKYEDENIITSITPIENLIGLSVGDYPKDWSSKRMKNEIKAKKNAIEASQNKFKDGCTPSRASNHGLNLSDYPSDMTSEEFKHLMEISYNKHMSKMKNNSGDTP